MKTYQIKKENVRQLAIDWQLECGERNTSYSELEYMTGYFERLGRRFGLIREFRENAII